MPIPGTIPVQIVQVPLDLTIDRKETAQADTTSTTTSQSQVQTQVDGEAIGRQIATAATTAIQAGIQQLIPGLSALKSQPPSQDWVSILAGAAAAAIPAAGYALSQRKVATIQRQRAEEHKADADDAWERLASSPNKS